MNEKTQNVGINPTMNAKIQDMFPGSTLRKEHGKVKLNVDSLDGEKVKEISKFIEGTVLTLDIKRSGTGLSLNFETHCFTT